MSSTPAQTPGKKEPGPIHVTGVVMTHLTPNPQRPRTAVAVDTNVDGELYVNMNQCDDAKAKVCFFAKDWDFISKQVDQLIAKERLLK